MQHRELAARSHQFRSRGASDIFPELAGRNAVAESRGGPLERASAITLACATVERNERLADSSVSFRRGIGEHARQLARLRPLGRFCGSHAWIVHIESRNVSMVHFMGMAQVGDAFYGDARNMDCYLDRLCHRDAR